MAQMVFRVVGLAVQNNERGEEMRALTLRAVEGEAFRPTDSTAPVNGAADLLVTPEYIKAKKLHLGDTVTLDIQEQ